jgi:hypothetical protein
MFYCEPCAEERNWPDSMMKSYGRCEICGEVRVCNDRASSTLPLPPKVAAKWDDIHDSFGNKISGKETFDDILERLNDRLNRLS